MLHSPKTRTEYEGVTEDMQLKMGFLQAVSRLPAAVPCWLQASSALTNPCRQHTHGMHCGVLYSISTVAAVATIATAGHSFCHKATHCLTCGLTEGPATITACTHELSVSKAHDNQDGHSVNWCNQAKLYRLCGCRYCAANKPCCFTCGYQRIKAKDRSCTRVMCVRFCPTRMGLASGETLLLQPCSTQVLCAHR